MVMRVVALELARVAYAREALSVVRIGIAGGDEGRRVVG